VTAPLESIEAAIRLRVRQLDDGAIEVVIPAGAMPAEADDVLAFPFGFEVKAARSLVQRGVIQAAHIGRKLYARRSAVLAAIDAIAAEQRAARAVERDAKPGNDAAADYANVVALARGKRAGGGRS